MKYYILCKFIIEFELYLILYVCETVDETNYNNKLICFKYLNYFKYTRILK